MLVDIEKFSKGKSSIKHTYIVMNCTLRHKLFAGIGEFCDIQKMTGLESKLKQSIDVIGF